MKWATVFQQVAARPEAVDEIARLNGTTPDEIRSQVERQTTCAGANYDLARKAKDALSRQAERSDGAKRLEEEARKRLEEEAKKKVKDEIKDKLEEEARKAWEEQQQRARQQQEQAQREQAQRAEQQRQQTLREQAQRETLQRQQAQRGSQVSTQRSSQPASQGGKKSGGCSKSLRRLLGAAALIGALLASGIRRQASPAPRSTETRAAPAWRHTNLPTPGAGAPQVPLVARGLYGGALPARLLLRRRAPGLARLQAGERRGELAPERPLHPGLQRWLLPRARPMHQRDREVCEAIGPGRVPKRVLCCAK